MPKGGSPFDSWADRGIIEATERRKTVASDRIRTSERQIKWEDEEARALLEENGVTEKTLKAMLRDLNARARALGSRSSGASSLSVRVMWDAEEDELPIVQIVAVGLGDLSGKERAALRASMRRYFLMPDDVMMTLNFRRAGA